MIDYIDCAEIAKHINEETRQKAQKCNPTLQVMFSEDVNESDRLYLKGIEKDAERLGISVSEEHGDGILYLGQSWRKWGKLVMDIDGVSKNAERIMSVVEATMLVITNEVNVSGKAALVVGRGRVGNQIARELLKLDATVSICHTKTESTTFEVLADNADIIVNTGAKDIMFNASNCSVAVDLTGADNKWYDYYTNMRLTPRINGIGLITRAILLKRLVDRCV